MFIDTWNDFLNEFVSTIEPVSGIVKDFLYNLFLNIPEFEKLFLIASGVAFLSVGLFIFKRLISH